MIRERECSQEPGMSDEEDGHAVNLELEIVFYNENKIFNPTIQIHFWLATPGALELKDDERHRKLLDDLRAAAVRWQQRYPTTDDVMRDIQAGEKLESEIKRYLYIQGHPESSIRVLYPLEPRSMTPAERMRHYWIQRAEMMAEMDKIRAELFERFKTFMEGDSRMARRITAEFDEATVKQLLNVDDVRFLGQ